MSAETTHGESRGAVASTSNRSTANFATSNSTTATPSASLLEAEDLEVVLPSGDGVGPWSGTLAAGDHVLLIGPSGAGKSTLLRTLAGAIPSHQHGRVTGSIRVGGIDPVADGVVAASRTVGYLGQDPASGVCLPDVADDVALPLENRQVPAPQIGGRVHAALTAAGAEGLASRKASTLSGGQLQRAALAAVLAAEPRLLLLDEPTAMLDAGGIAAVRGSVQAALQDGETAAILVEHRLDEWAGADGLAALPPRTIALDRSGRVLADGPTHEVLLRHGATLRAEGCWLPRDLERSLNRMLERPPEESFDEPAEAATPAGIPPAAPRGSRASEQEQTPEETVAPGRAADPGRPLLTADGVALGYEGRRLLEGVDLEVRSGQVLAVVGRNGSGKSTLLTALARLDQPHAGAISGAAAGLVFQRPEAQFISSTVVGELRASGAEEAAVGEMLEQLALDDRAEASPYRLSGGQQRRLSLGAMLLTGRPVLLADEPGFGLDQAAQDSVHELLRESAANGRAVVMTTHDLRAVEQAHAVAVLADGRVHGPMPPAQLLADADLLRRAGLVASPSAETGRPERDDRGERAGEDRGGAGTADPPLVPHGWLSRRNPTVLLGLLTALSIVCIALTDPVPLVALYVLLMAATLAGCRMRPLALLRGQVPFMVFAVGVFTVNVLSRPGREPWPELPVRVTQEGLVLGTALALRALVIGLGALAVARATDPRRTMVSLQQHARLPARYAYALLAGRRLLDDLPSRWATITRAHRARLPVRTDGTVGRLRPRQLVRCAFSLLVDAIRSAERLAFALESRGLGEGPRTIWRPVPCDRADLLLAVAVATAIGTVVVLS
ncbi:ATP-binding cassette domain-containing protein [Brachybacterium tyrofermentans]|uniref:ATP-binding cassette domain-containing protein n=1 Tax=Brachybacterium tyrofermentans TaxID=47848 RepID=A0ABW0FGI3_9MICO